MKCTGIRRRIFRCQLSFRQAKEKERDFQSAAVYFDAALTNSSWHANSDDARMRRGKAFYEVGKVTKKESEYEKALPLKKFEEIQKLRLNIVQSLLL